MHYATADLLSGSERDLRQQRRELFQAACRQQEFKRLNCWTPSTAGGHPADRAGRHDRGSIRRL